MVLPGLALMASAHEAMATLGQAPTAVMVSPKSTTVAAAKRLAAMATTPSSSYTIHETSLENGTTVREFSTPAGVVFAATWRGPVLPDMGTLLGDYFKIFKAETDHARALGKRGSVNIQRSNLVVSSGGRMRNFFGYAYAPGLIPTGVNVNDLLQ
jgi:hypothetical protein